MNARIACLRLPLLCLSLWPLAAQPAVYRWQDADGRVHFSDRPRPGAELIPPEALQPQVMPAIEVAPSPPPQPQPRRSAAPSAREARADQCRRVEEGILALNARLRAGYRLAEGERLKDRLRSLKLKRHKLQCRF